MFSRTATVVGVALTLTGTFAIAADPVEPGDYRQVETFNLPPSHNGTGDFDDNVLFDALADGRLLLLNGPNVSVETAVGSRTYTELGTVGAGFAAQFGPSFLAVSPDGTKVATGDNGTAVFVFDAADPTNAQSFALPDFDGTWVNNNELLISNFLGIQHLNIASGTVTTLIDNFDGGSGGLVLDDAGNLLVGKGYDNSPGVGTETGWIKQFDAASWQGALTGGTTLDFAVDGVNVADLLSASKMALDADDNLLVGGADFFGGSGDLGYAAIVDGDAIAAAVLADAATPTIDMNSPADVLRQVASPQDTIAGFLAPGWTFNEATGEAYLTYFNDSQVRVFVPEPATAMLLSVAGLGLMRRRRAA